VARERTPDPLNRRHLLERAIDGGQALRIAENYLAEGRRVEAIAFLERAEAHEQLQSLCEAAQTEGDVFLLKAVCRALGRDPERREWESACASAEASGKLRYAELARRQIDGGEG
jgi:hypothetical protein